MRTRTHAAAHVFCCCLSPLASLLPSFLAENHEHTVRGEHSAARDAVLSGVVAFHFSTGFPGMVPAALASEPEAAIEAPAGTLLAAYPHSVRASVARLVAAAPPADRARALAAGVTGQLLYFDEAVWPAARARLDRLEDFSHSSSWDNMYERVRVTVRARKGRSKHVAATGAAGGAGAAPEPAAAAAAEASGDGGEDEWEDVDAWTYFCLLDPESLSPQLVVDGDWRAHMKRTAQVDAGDDWAAASGAAAGSSGAGAGAMPSDGSA